MKRDRTTKIVNVMEKNRKYPFMRLRDKWLAELGFTEGATAYITIVGSDTITISSSPPMLVRQELTPIEIIKAEYAKLGIPTTEKKKYQVTMVL